MTSIYYLCAQDPELPPLHVRIETRMEPGFSVVTVEDTGPGFNNPLTTSDPTSKTIVGKGLGVSSDEDDFAGRPISPTSALSNIHERLAAFDATLDIASREEGGTRAIIRVPLREQDDS